MPQVVVFDTETTGFGNTNQIVEIAGVIFDTDFGEVVGEFDTLVRPTRSIDGEASLKHGLRASDLSLAPTFEEIAPMIARLMHRRIAISYGISFDSSVLNREFQRSNIDFQITQTSCAMSPFGSSPPKLEDAAAQAGHSLSNWHSALADARAALKVAEFHGWELMTAKAGRTEHFASNVRIRSLRTFSRYQAGLSDKFDLNRFSRKEEFRDATAEELYLLLLDEFLKDRELSNEELIALDEFASENNISDGLKNELHRDYFKAIEAAAMRGGVTEREARILNDYASILGVDTEVIVAQDGVAIPPKGSVISHTGDSLLNGKPVSKSEIRELLDSLGYVFTDDLKKSDEVSLLLVADDGHTSGKTKKAEAWGIPVTTLDKFISGLQGH